MSRVKAKCQCVKAWSSTAVGNVSQRTCQGATRAAHEAFDVGLRVVASYSFLTEGLGFESLGSPE